MSAGFGDLNQNGKLDIVLGNWSSGVEKLFSPEESENIILFREGNSYRKEYINEIKVESNALLVADITGDNLTDLLIGNDRLVPDVYHINQGNGVFKPISKLDHLVPITSMFTMSIDTADFNNDLKPDIFNTDMTFARSSLDNYCSSISDATARNHCEDMLISYNNFNEGSAINCERHTNLLERQECYIIFSVKAAKDLKSSKFCSTLPDNNAAIFSLCEYLASPVPIEESLNQDSLIPQVQRNTLLINHDDKFIESAEKFGVSSSFWSWNAKATDLDNDSWQDIYVGNGFHFGDSFYEIQENILFHNINGDHFEQRQSEWGLNDSIIHLAILI